MIRPRKQCSVLWHNILLKENFKPLLFKNHSPLLVGRFAPRVFTPLFVILFFLPAFFSLCLSCKPSSRIYERTQFMMGTIVEIKAVGEDQTLANKAIDRAFLRIKEIEGEMSAKIRGNCLDKICRDAFLKPLNIPDDIYHVIEVCLKYSELTDGAFDISIGAITKFWRFDEEMEEIPGAEKVKNALEYVGFHKIHLHPKESGIELDCLGMTLDLGAAAKGYAADEAVRVLQESGITGGIVNAGGDIKAFGRKPDNSLWTIGIQDPDNPQGIIGSLCISDKALVTSGDYERYIMKNGIKYHHIVDPKTGWPARECKSVSISCANALDADILATAVFVLGPKKGMELLRNMPLVEGLIIDASGNRYVTDGWKEVF